MSMPCTVPQNEDRFRPHSATIWDRVRHHGRLLGRALPAPGAHWSGPELADRLGVTVRTVRRDVERLRHSATRSRPTPGGRWLPPRRRRDGDAAADARPRRGGRGRRLPAVDGDRVDRRRRARPRSEPSASSSSCSVVGPPAGRTIASMTARLDAAPDPPSHPTSGDDHPRVSRRRAAASRYRDRRGRESSARSIRIAS